MAVGRLSKLSVFLSHLLLVLAIHHINLGYETSYSITDIKLGQTFARPPILIRKSQSSCFATNRPLVRWNKHGGTVIALPSDDRLYDINIRILICGDVHPLPGPDSLSSRKGNNPNKLLDLPKAGVNIVSWNICNISNKLDELAHLLLHGNIDILGLQETFLNSNTLDSVLQVNGFNFFRKDRGANGGGILVYIRNSLKVLRRSDLESDDCEMLWLQLFERKHSAISLIGFIYRPPSSDSSLDECIASNIEAACIKSSKIYILGDVNVNILNRTSNNNNLFKALKDLGLRQIVNSVTRPSSSACLDHIYTNCQNSTTHCKVHEIGLSDHFPISFTLRKPKQSRNHHLVKTFRSFKNFDEHGFYQDLQSAPWSILDVFTDDPDSYLSNWYLIFNDVLDKHAPLITKRVKMEKQAPWWNSEINSLSKIVERHVFLSLSSWFNKFNLLFSSQSSYRKHHSCITAMVNLVDQLIANMDDKLISSLLMIDLSKAFDTINHELLITKLSIYGVSPSSLKWFKAYLTSRRQYVRIDNVDSNSQIIRHGVPQGSILGPLLFIIFMNDINLVPISDCELHLYADDTTMLTCSPTMDQLMTTTNQALTTIVDWFLKNKLIVNLKKTECMTVMTKAKERFTSENNSTLSIDGNQIKQVLHHKLLGLVIDSHLTWNDHVDYIVSKAASRLFLLKKIKPFLSLKERKLFYSSMIMPVLEYGSVIWGDFYVGITERLLKQQKRAARIILDVKKPTDTPSADLFAKLNWLSFDKRIILQRGTLVYKCLNNLAPDYLCNIFTKLKDARSRITRAFTNDKLALQRKFRLAVGQKSFLYRGTHLWNSLPLEITKSNDLNNFRTKLFRFLM